MELRKLIKNENGQYEATWLLTSEQMATLYWYAINDLVARGLAQVLEITPEHAEQMKKEMVNAYALDALANADVKDLPRA